MTSMHSALALLQSTSASMITNAAVTEEVELYLSTSLDNQWYSPLLCHNFKLYVSRHAYYIQPYVVTTCQRCATKLGNQLDCFTTDSINIHPKHASQTLQKLHLATSQIHNRCVGSLIMDRIEVGYSSLIRSHLAFIILRVHVGKQSPFALCAPTCSNLTPEEHFRKLYTP